MSTPPVASPPRPVPGHPLGIVRWTEKLLSLDAAGPPGLPERATLLFLVRFARLASLVSLRPAGRTAWAELANTASTFRLFRLGARLLPREDRRLDLAPLMERLRQRGLFESLWATEGVGYYRAEERPADPALLGDEVTGLLPLGSLVPLHVGAGLALARARLESGDRRVEEAPAMTALLDEIRSSSATGSAGVGIEAIGLFVRTLLPDRLPAVDAAVDAQGPDVRAWFWHGVGRAIYFLFPSALFGDSGWKRVTLESPDESALRPATAGFVWALCLVNFGEPAVIEAFLRRHGEDLDEDAFRHGLVGTTLVWHAWAEVDGRLRRLLEPRPSAADLRWDDRVRRPLRHALEHSAPRLRRDRDVERLFLFRPR